MLHIWLFLAPRLMVISGMAFFSWLLFSWLLFSSSPLLPNFASRRASPLWRPARTQARVSSPPIWIELSRCNKAEAATSEETNRISPILASILTKTEASTSSLVSADWLHMDTSACPAVSNEPAAVNVTSRLRPEARGVLLFLELNVEADQEDG